VSNREGGNPTVSKRERCLKTELGILPRDRRAVLLPPAITTSRRSRSDERHLADGLSLNLWRCGHSRILVFGFSTRAEVLGRRLLASRFSFTILSAIEVLWLACSSAQRFVTGDS